MFRNRLAHVCFHLVRDNAPESAPDFPALLEHVRELAAMGYTGICLEPEAMFPFASAPDVATRLTWTPEQVKRLADLCAELHLEVVPLIQCLGHNYYVLERPAYAHLREMPGSYQQYCPTNPQTRRRFMAMAEDLLRAFPTAKRLHIGGDECRMLGECPRCKAVAQEQGVSALYCQHVGEVCGSLIAKGVVPLLWSDMCEHYPESVSRLPRAAELVYWNYEPANWPRPPAPWDAWRSASFRVWGASAVFYGSAVSDLAGPYHTCLQGIDDLVRMLAANGVQDYMVTNWTKGTAWELSDWGFFYAARKSCDLALSGEEIAAQYAAHRFGLPDGRITRAHQLLSVPLPFGESIQDTWWNRRNRLDFTGMPYDERRARRLTPEGLPEAQLQVKTAVENAVQALRLLHDLKPEIKRGLRQWTLLENAAREMLTRGQAGEVALRDAERDAAGANRFGLAAGLEGVRYALRARERMASEVYSGGTPPQAVSAIMRIRYSPDERHYLGAVSRRLTGTGLEEGRNMSVLPVLYNPGAPYERGLEHGRVFADMIWDNIRSLSAHKYDPELLRSRDSMEKYLFNHLPWMLDEMRGIAQGAGLSFESVFWLNVFNAVTPEDRLAPAGCSTVLLCRAGVAGLLKTSDIDPAQRRRMIVQVLDHDGMKAMVCGWAGTLWCEWGLNSAGLAAGANSGPRVDKQSGEGIPQHCGAYPAIVGCRNVEEAVAFWKAHPFAGKGLNIGVIDRDGRGAVCEISAHRMGVRAMKDGFLAATNHYLLPDTEPLNAGKSEAAMAESVARLRRIGGFFEANRQPVVEALMACAALDEGEGAVCKRVCPCPGAGETLAATVMEPAAGAMWLTGVAPADGGWGRISFQDYPGCRSA